MQQLQEMISISKGTDSQRSRRAAQAITRIEEQTYAIAASVTSRTWAVAVAVSSTDGNARLFTHGELILQTDPTPPVWKLDRMRHLL